MYKKHFGLIDKPYNYLIPDPRYFYYSDTSKNIKGQCDYIVGEKNGHLFLSGEIGSGKTTLLKTVAQALYSDEKNIINFINAPNLKTSNSLMRRVSEGFKVKTWRSYSKTLELFTDWLKKTDKFPILIVDEAQNLTRDSLKTLHYLMTYVSDKLLMMIILCGQSEMATKIERFPAIRSRMFPASLSSLSRDDTEEMLKFRWSVATSGKTKNFPFTKKAIDEMFNFSKGNPRAICQLADIALLAGFTRKQKKIDSKIVQIAINNLTVKK